MPTPTTEVTYRVADLEAIYGLMLGIPRATVQAVAGAGWLGVWRPGESNAPAPQPESDGPRTIWARFEVVHMLGVRQVLDSGGSPYREGKLTLHVYYQLGFDDLEIARVEQIFRQAIANASSETGIAYSVAAPPTIGTANTGWPVSTIDFPFKAVY